jgi:xylulose-5-phosphate/fructose-6-phosphate phosphoketolase
MLNTRNVVNLTTFNKIDEPRFLDKENGGLNFHTGGASIFESVSDDDPDFVFVGVGDLVSKEVIEAINILRRDLPEYKYRFVNVNALSYRAIGTTNAKLTKEQFEKIFTKDRPIIANFHGYPETFETILENYTYRGRVRVHGFVEEGSTTTPFEMLRRNVASRYDLAIDVATVLKRNDLVEKYQETLDQNHEHAIQFGEDLIK